jgi:hypothetical protein
MIPASIAVSVALVVGGGLLALRMWLQHASKKLEHAPVADMQRKLDDIEQRLMAGAMRR